MIAALERDMRIAPSSFEWLGEASAETLRRWVACTPWRFPAALAALWERTGGGDLFETEELLAPDAAGDYNLVNRNRQLWASGLPSSVIVFHVGLYLTGVTADGRIQQVDPDTLMPLAQFASMTDWYSDLRGEYASRYGLPDAATVPPRHASIDPD